MNRPLRWEDRLFTEASGIIEREGAGRGVRQAVLALYERQRENWPEFIEALQKLDNAAGRTLQLDGRQFRLQHNPARIANVSAPTGSREVARRPCPLCPSNMPDQQQALPFLDNWLVVCNPLPLFKQHFVLVHREHTPQCAATILPAMIEFTRLTGFVTLYNGPRSGASIPDHLHLQAVPPGGLPLEQQLPQMGGREIIVDSRLPHRIFLDASESARAGELFERTLEALAEFKIEENDLEPGMNVAVIAGSDSRPPLVAIHPRSKHKPRCFYAQGEDRYVVSPGSADMAGMLILPRREDFLRLDEQKVELIFSEICLDPEQLAQVKENLPPGAQTNGQ